MVENVKELLKAHEGLRQEVYLDNENATMVPNEILEAMKAYYSERGYGNPTLTHRPGWQAYEAIMESAQKISKFLGTKSPEDINFMPGETEANNVAFIGTTASTSNRGKSIIISEIEPVSIIQISEVLKKNGFAIVRIPVDQEGFVNLKKLEEAVNKDTALVSLSAVNHEIGTIQPIEEAVKIVKGKNPSALFHSDLSDAFGKIPIDLKQLGLDLATVSSYKILGPRGIGALYTKEKVNVERILEGQIGTQRLWPGIENTPAIIGFAAAADVTFSRFESNVNHVRRLRDMLMDGIMKDVPEVLLNGPNREKRAADNLNISFLKCEGEALTIELSLNGVYVSSGSACSRRLLQPSHVLVAIGRKFDEAHGSILMKTTRYQTEEDIKYALDVIPRAVERIREITGSTGVQ